MTARGSDPGCDLSRCSRDRDGFGSEYLDLLVAVRTVHTGILISRSGHVRNIGLRGRARATDRQGGTSFAHRPGRQGRGAGRRRAKPRWGGASPPGQRQGLARVGVLRVHGLSSAGATFPRRYGWAEILREIRTKGVRDSYVYPYEDTHRIHCSDGSFSRLGGGVDSQPPHGTSCPRRTSCDGSDWRVVVYAWVVLDDNGVARSFVRPGLLTRPNGVAVRSPRQKRLHGEHSSPPKVHTQRRSRRGRRGVAEGACIDRATIRPYKARGSSSSFTFGVVSGMGERAWLHFITTPKAYVCLPWKKKRRA